MKSKTRNSKTRHPRQGIQDKESKTRNSRQGIQDNETQTRSPRQGIQDKDSKTRNPRQGIHEKESKTRSPRPEPILLPISAMTPTEKPLIGESLHVGCVMRCALHVGCVMRCALHVGCVMRCACTFLIADAVHLQGQTASQSFRIHLQGIHSVAFWAQVGSLLGSAVGIHVSQRTPNGKKGSERTARTGR